MQGRNAAVDRRERVNARFLVVGREQVACPVVRHLHGAVTEHHEIGVGLLVELHDKIGVIIGRCRIADAGDLLGVEIRGIRRTQRRQVLRDQKRLDKVIFRHLVRQSEFRKGIAARVFLRRRDMLRNGCIHLRFVVGIEPDHQLAGGVDVVGNRGRSVLNGHIGDAAAPVKCVLLRGLRLIEQKRTEGAFGGVPHILRRFRRQVAAFLRACRQNTDRHRQAHDRGCQE